MAAHPHDVGSACATGNGCQSGLCAYVQGLDASGVESPKSPTVCSAPCWKASDCLPNWTCTSEAPQGPIVMPSAGPGVCTCSLAPEACDGKDHNCDGVVDEEPGASAACSATLGAPAKCVDAGCECMNTCDGGCVNLVSDSKNCGACGRTCTPGLQVCSGSDCVCAGVLCPVPDGGPGDAGYLVAEGGPGGTPAVCFNTQMDPNNCGGCGVVCHYSCNEGCVPLLLATIGDNDGGFGGGGSVPVAIASNGSELLMLTAANGGLLQECGVAGCNHNPITITSGFNTNQTGTGGLLALGGSWAYWPTQTAVMDVTISSRALSPFAQQANASVYAVATNATKVFWSDANLGISSCPLGVACTSPSVVAPRSSLAAAPQQLAADQAYVYWMDTNGDVFSLALAGGTPVPLSTGAGEAGFPTSSTNVMVASGGRVYYADPTMGVLVSAAGGMEDSATMYSSTSPTAIATDGVSLYWATPALVKCPLGASCSMPTTIYASTVTSLAVDGTSVYWVDDGSNDPNNNNSPQVWAFQK
jgi:hypothetical protein